MLKYVGAYTLCRFASTFLSLLAGAPARSYYSAGQHKSEFLEKKTVVSKNNCSELTKLGLYFVQLNFLNNFPVVVGDLSSFDTAVVIAGLRPFYHSTSTITRKQQPNFAFIPRRHEVSLNHAGFLVDNPCKDN